MTFDPNARAAAELTLPEDVLSLLSAVLSNAPFGFALVDTDLRYLHVNEALAAVNGLPADQHRGLHPRDISPALDDLVGPMIRQVLDTGDPVVGLRLTLPSPADGDHDWLFSAYRVATQDSVVGVAAAVVDVTDQTRTLARLEALTRQQAAVVEVGMAALRGEPVRKVAAAALTTIRAVLEVDRVALLRSERGGAEFVLEAVEPANPQLLEAVVVRPGDRTMAGETLSTDAPIVSSDVASDDRFDTVAIAGDMTVRSAMAVLVPGHDGPFGVLGIYHAARRDINDDEVRFVQAIGNVIGTAVERRRTERALETSDKRLRMAQEAGRMGVWEWDLRSGTIVWSEALELLWGLLPGTFGGDLESFRRQVHAEDIERVEAALQHALEVGGYELEHRIIRADTNEVRWIVARGDTIRDEAGEPVRMVGINIDITERKLVEEERLSLLHAEQTARAAAERSREQLTFLSEATGALSASLDYRETLQAVTRLAVPEYADLCIVDLLEAGRLATVAVAHADRAVEQQVWELRRRYPAATAPDDPTHETMRYAQPLVFTDMPEDVLAAMAVDAEHLKLLNRLDVRSGIIVPLIARGRVLGTLALLRTSGRDPFDTADDQTMVTELGRRAALAIDNSRLFAEAERTGERFRRMAETLQASLLPPHLPAVPGVDVAATYRAAAAGTTVGGDFYDVFPLTDRGWGVVIGDVQGKGTEAATVTGIARHTIRTAAMRRNPAGSLHMLNEALLTAEEHGGRFCTVLYGQLECEEGILTIDFASGGHPPAVLRRASGHCETVGGGGTLMGVVDNITLATQHVELAEGDALLLYTDGVPDVRGPEGEFGEQRLIDVVCSSQAITAEELITDVERAVTRFCGGRFRDDIAMVVLRASSQS